MERKKKMPNGLAKRGKRSKSKKTNQFNHRRNVGKPIDIKNGGAGFLIFIP